MLVVKVEMECFVFAVSASPSGVEKGKKKCKKGKKKMRRKVHHWCKTFLRFVY